MTHQTVSVRTAILCSISFLAGLGLLAIYASSSISADQIYNDSFFYLKKQSSTLLLGMVMVFLMGYVPISWIKRAPLPLFVFSIFLISMTLIPSLAHEAKGAARWVKIPGIGVTFQPSEVAKIAVIFFLAKNLSLGQHKLNSIPWLVTNLVSFGVVAFFLMMQPDFGSTILIFAVTFLMMIVGGLSKRYTAAVFACGIAGVVAAILAAPYRMKRLFTFIDPWADAYSGGFQIIQSYVGFQNGGVFGLGLGESKQKLFFLPDAHTDFILAVIGEELGMVGVIFVCLVFAYLCLLCAKVTLGQSDPFLRFLAFGITALISIQAFLNMGVAMGLLPTKGIPLPFVSNGRSSLIVFLFCIGIICRLAHQNEKTAKELAT